MQVYFLYENLKFGAEITYTLNALAGLVRTKASIADYSEVDGTRSLDDVVVVSYGRHKPDVSPRRHIHIFESRLFGKDYLAKESLPQPPLAVHRGIPVIYLAEGDAQEHLSTSDGTVETRLDIIASAFYMLTRYEEVIDPQVDDYGRSPATASIAYREGFLQIPVVDAYARMLGEWMESLGARLPSRSGLWEGHAMAAAVTCDVDWLRKFHSLRPPLRSLMRAVGARHVQTATRLVRNYASAYAVRCGLRRDPYDNLVEVQDAGRAEGFPITFFVRTDTETLAPGTKRRGVSAPVDYDVMSNGTRLRLWKLRDRGAEIALHPGADTYLSKDKLITQKERLEAALTLKVSGARQHYLQWKASDTWQAYQQAALLYDASVGYPQNEGFRCGVCTPVRAFDLRSRQELDVWILPLALMEMALFQGTPCTDGVEEGLKDALSRARRLVDQVEEYGGVFVLLWHNSQLDDRQYPGIRSVYSDLLKYLAGKSPLALTCSQAINHWKSAMLW